MPRLRNWTLILSCFLKLNLGLFSMKRIIHIPFAWAWLIQCSLMKCNEVYLDCFSLAIINSFVRNLPESPLWSTMQTWVHKVAWQKSSELSDYANRRLREVKIWIIYEQWTEQLATCQRGNNWRPPCTCSCRLPGSGASHCLKFTPLSRSIYHNESRVSLIANKRNHL